MTEPTDAGPNPCPFCGSSNIVHYEVEGRANHSFECCECLAASMCKTTHQEALAAWNRRTPQPTQAQAGAVPLTVEQIKEICRQHIGRDKSKDEPNTGAWPDSVALTRAIERAHGIGIKGGQHGGM